MGMIKNPFDTISNPTKLQIAILEDRKRTLIEYMQEKQNQIEIIDYEIEMLKEKL
jgi:hypothetical protein